MQRQLAGSERIVLAATLPLSLKQLPAAGFPVPALAAGLLPGRVAHPPGGQPAAGQVEQHVVAVRQADHQRLDARPAVDFDHVGQHGRPLGTVRQVRSPHHAQAHRAPAA